MPYAIDNVWSGLRNVDEGLRNVASPSMGGGAVPGVGGQVTSLSNILGSSLPKTVAPSATSVYPTTSKITEIPITTVPTTPTEGATDAQGVADAVTEIAQGTGETMGLGSYESWLNPTADGGAMGLTVDGTQLLSTSPYTWSGMKSGYRYLM